MTNDNTIMCITAPCGQSEVESNINETFLQKNKTNLLILGGAVLVFFAYKKFKK